MIERIELSTNAYSLDDVLTKIVDHYNRTKQIGPVKRETQVIRQSDGKDGNVGSLASCKTLALKLSQLISLGINSCFIWNTIVLQI